MIRQIRENEMVQSEADQPACFVVNEDLVVSIGNGEGTTLSLQLTPDEARGFARAFLALADDVEAREGDLGLLECAGEA